MPLNKGLRDQESERISNILKNLNELIYVPDFRNEQIDGLLKGIGLNHETLLIFSPSSLIEHLNKLNFDWQNAEGFADFLVDFSSKSSENEANLKEKALIIYNYIQAESKTFSFEIFNKITKIKV